MVDSDWAPERYRIRFILPGAGMGTSPYRETDFLTSSPFGPVEFDCHLSLPAIAPAGICRFFPQSSLYFPP